MTTALAKPQQPAHLTLEKLFSERKELFAKVLPRHMDPERLFKVALLARSRSPKLLKCTPESMVKALLQCAEMGLEPSGSVGGAHLVPFENKKTGVVEVTVIPDYRGLIDVARRSGEIISIEAHVINARDKFEIKFGLDPVLTHTPTLDGDPGEMMAVYAVARLKGGAVQSEVMTRAQVDKIRARSQGGQYGPWVSDYEAMAKKTVIKQICKFLPRSRELSAALVADEPDTIEGELAESMVAPQSQTEKVKQLVKKSAAVVDVKPGESEAQAEARMLSEPPPPSDADFVPDMDAGVGA